MTLAERATSRYRSTGRLCQALRWQLGMSLREAELATGVSRYTISRLERGRGIHASQFLAVDEWVQDAHFRPDEQGIPAFTAHHRVVVPVGPTLVNDE